MGREAEALVNIENLYIRFYTYEGIVKALDGVNLHIRPGETLGLVGETGCGKSVTSLSILGIVMPPGKIEGGKVAFRDGEQELNVAEADEETLRKIRGSKISMVFQEPRAYLNPIFTVEFQLGEVLRIHRHKELVERVLKKIDSELKEESSGFRRSILNFYRNVYQRWLENPESRYVRFLLKIPFVRRFKKWLDREINEEVVKILRLMGIPDPERVAKMYPHELSGGMAQRVLIAMALICNPVLLIADEPTTNLDVTVQAQILHLIKNLKEQFKSSILYITHDLGVVAQICDRVAVMYAGTVVELADVFEIFKDPLHPYTRGLLESIPRPGAEFKSIPGSVPNLINPPSGCRFHPRCKFAMDICRSVKPEFKEVKKDHYVACHLFGGLKSE